MRIRLFEWIPVCVSGRPSRQSCVHDLLSQIPTSFSEAHHSAPSPLHSFESKRSKQIPTIAGQYQFDGTCKPYETCPMSHFWTTYMHWLDTTRGRGHGGTYKLLSAAAANSNLQEHHVSPYYSCTDLTRLNLRHGIDTGNTRNGPSPGITGML